MKPLGSLALALTIALAASALACTKDTTVRPDDSGATRHPTPAAPATSADAAPTAAPRSCEPEASTLSGLVTDARVAMDPLPALAKARTAWSQTRPDCRDAGWHLMAAHILRLDDGPLETDTIRFAAPREPLAAGLDLDGEDAALLVFVAYLAAVDPAAGPPLPEAACARVERAPPQQGPSYVTADRRRYVCGLAALRDRDFAAAERALAAIEDPRLFADVDLRLAEAMVGKGDRRGGAAAARRAADLSDNRGRAFGATASEIEAIRAAGKALLDAR